MKRIHFAVIALTLLAGLTHAQEKSQEPTAASLIEMGRTAEEQERNFTKAAELYKQAIDVATRLKDNKSLDLATQCRQRVQARAAGIDVSAPQGDEDPMICRLAHCMDLINRISSNTAQYANANNDIALFGAMAVPWLEKAIQAPIHMCNYDIQSNPPLYIRAIAMMTAPEGGASLERQLSSPDPTARRAVAEFADPERHRAILLRAIKDPAQAVRDRAIASLCASDDLKLFEVMSAAAREKNEDALSWISRYRPEQLLQDAGDAALSSSYRCRALAVLGNSENYRPNAASIDAMLLLARQPQENSVRIAAMQLLNDGTSTRWKPISQELARHIEDAILPALDSYPRESTLGTLMTIGGARSLSPILDGVAFDGNAGLGDAITRILSRASTADFAAVVAAFSRTSPPLRTGGDPWGGQLHGLLRSWLESMTSLDISSAELARGAATLNPGLRRIFIDRVVGPWIETRLRSSSLKAQLPSIDPSFVKLLRELAAEGNPNSLGMIATGFGATGDPKVLPDLMGLVTGDGMDPNIAAAIKRITADDLTRVKAVLELLLANKSITAQNFSETCRATIGLRQPAELLALVSSLWNKANSEKLMTIVARAVPGPEGSAFLLAHYAELDPIAAETRVNVIERFGQELYEPATDLIGAALRDPNDRVRNGAIGAFNRFRVQQAVIDDFNGWRKSDQQSKQTINELIPLLDSSNPDVVLGAVKALAGLKARTCYPKMILLLEKHKDNALVKAAVLQAIDELAK